MGGRQWHRQITRSRRLGAARETDARRIPREEPGAAAALRTGARPRAPDRRGDVRTRPPRVQQRRRSPGQRGDGRSGGRMTGRLAVALLLPGLLCPVLAYAEDPEAVTVRAYRLTQALVIDGRLDDGVYHTIPPAPAFRQQEPRVGELAAEQTEMWVLFDDRNIYVSARMHDSAPDRMVADEMRRDASIYQNEHFVVVFDTFHDRRTGFFFQTNPLGAVRDALIVDENNANYDWNTVWDVKVHRDETGWTSEMVIPFKSLRYPTGKDQVWGINARRWERRVNEHSLLSISPPGTLPNNSVQRLASAGTLVGIEVPPPARNIELKPYGVSNLT